MVICAARRVAGRVGDFREDSGGLGRRTFVVIDVRASLLELIGGARGRGRGGGLLFGVSRVSRVDLFEPNVRAVRARCPVRAGG